MADPAVQADRLLNQMNKQNPAAADSNKPAKERRRIPMTAPQRKLELPHIPGYYTQWIRSDPARIQQALNAGFQFVTPEEVGLNNRLLGDDGLKSGNTDLGSRVSIADGTDERGNIVSLYAMKQKEEYHEEDLRIRQRVNDGVADALTAAFRGGSRVGGEGAPSETATDVQNRYVDKARTKIPTLFQRKR